MKEFEATVPPEHEVVIQVVGYGPNVSFSLTSVHRTQGPLLLFKGNAGGSPVEIIQPFTK